jgi:hypothetical protein
MIQMSRVYKKQAPLSGAPVNGSTTTHQDFIAFFDDEGTSSHPLNSNGMQLPPEALDIYDQQGSIDCLPDGGFLPQNTYKKIFKKAKNK